MNAYREHDSKLANEKGKKKANEEKKN